MRLMGPFFEEGCCDVKGGVVHEVEVVCSRVGCTQKSTRWVVRWCCGRVAVVEGVMRELRFGLHRAQ